MSDPTVTYGSYWKSTSCSRCSSRAPKGPNTTRCCSSSFTRSTSCGSSRCCTRSIASVGCSKRRRASRAAHAEAHPHHPEGARRAARHPRDDDAARVPVVSRAAGSGERISVGPVPPARVRARQQVAARRSSAFRDGGRARHGARGALSAADAVGRVPAVSRARRLRGAGGAAVPRRHGADRSVAGECRRR